MTTARVTFQIADNPPARLDKALALNVPVEAALSRTRLARLLQEGCVLINGVEVRDPKAKVAEGAEVEILVPVADESHIGPEDIPLEVIYEDDDLIVINKPTGMVVHPAPGTPNGTLVNALLHHCGDTLSGVGGSKRPGIVHRIDKDTSGLLVVAKSDRAHHGLAAQFEKHTVERYYNAVVYGEPDAHDPRLRGVRGVSFESGNIMRITTQLARHKTDRQRQAVLFEGGRHAVTRCRIVETFGAPSVVSLVECWLETGRTHQIRVHMTHAGHSLIGDPTYGGRRKLSEKALTPAGVVAAKNFDRQALHAAVLGFVHPVTKEDMRFEAPIPDDMAALIEALRQQKLN
ncbi:RluA family pseudouridine synthase [Cognatishimia sp. 1_MG-2023]|uniref:RluA family pseudouridine synthase n=1 Tax=Cognatishimia sp. 1_MG-2023 TaxID=3062642 RepID=UPI0026E24695|nr:RluA family pseudouridine synthase [Cognatishimia sp. 1_MG-2023]MDO6726304.1 RluA family pseudouridine synthase [Cognatishimia sp. 1_MG-2023]